METKKRVPTKILSLFLSVLMACSCFTIALPSLSANAKAAASADQWQELVDAFTAAYSGGFFSTDPYAVSDDGAGHLTVADTTTNGYIYAVVRALINVAAAEKSEENDHNATIRTAIKAGLEARMSVSPAMKEFIDEVLPVPAELAGDYHWYGDQCWQGLKTDEAKPTADVTMTLTVTRSVKSAVLTDYADAAVVPEQVETEYTLTTTAKAYEGASDLGDNYCTVWYQNDSMAASAGMTNAPDLSAIVAYNNLVYAADWQADYVAYTEDELSVYQHTKAELEAIYDDYVAAETAANQCDPDYVEKFIGAAYMNAYRTYANFCFTGKEIPESRKYVDWINGIPISGYEGFADSLNKNDYSEDDRAKMEALKAQAQAYLTAINATGTTTVNILVHAYGYDTNAYSNYINELTAKIQTFDMKDILKAYNYMIENAAPAEYVFPQGSQFYTADGYTPTDDTAIDEDTVYYTMEMVDEKPVYTRVETPDAAQLESYYEYVPHYSVSGVGNDTFYSQPYVESGHECPLGDEDLAVTYAWLTGAITTVNNTPVAVRRAVISDSVLSQMTTLKNQLNEEIIYRGFDDASQAFATEYAYFVNLMLNTSLAGMSDVALKGRADDPETEVNEYVKGLIAEATEHYNTLNTAYTTCANACSNGNVKTRYTAFKNKAYAYIGSIYAVLFNRTYNKLTTIRNDINTYGGIGASNFSLVKGGVAGFDEDQEADGIQNAMYTWLINNRSTVQSRGPVASNLYDDMINIFNALPGWRETANSYGAGGWGAWGSTRYYCDGNTGTYVTRNARSDDMVRYIAGDGATTQRYAYTVTNTKIETVITKLDTFLKSDSFIKLIDKYDPSAGITDLTTFIESILVENIFTNNIINTIVTALFPMICDLLENQLKGMMQNMVINGTNVSVGTAGGYDFTWNVRALLDATGADTGDLSIDSGYADGAFNGTQGTNTFASVFGGLGVNIYPNAFSTSLPASLNGLSNNLSTLKTRLTNAGTNWDNMDRTDFGGDGNGTLDKDDLAWVDWGVRDYNTAVNAMAAVFGSILPLARTLFCNQQFQGNVSRLLFVRARDLSGSYSGVHVGLDNTTGYASGTLTIAGIQGFNNLWAPLVEALGVQSHIASTNPTVSAAVSTTIGSTTNASALEIVRCLLMPVYSLIKTVAANPLSTVTKILPNIAYSVSYNLIQPLLNILTLNLNINASLDITEFGRVEALASWINVSGIASWFEGSIESAVSDALNFDVPLELGSKMDLSDMLGADITNLNALAGKIFGMIGNSEGTSNAITLPAINSAYLGRLGDRTELTGSPRTYNYDGSGLGSGHYYYVVADRADVLYDVLKWVLNFASQPGALVGLLSSFGLDGLPEGIDELLSNIQVNDAIAALVELFLPRGLSGSGYSTGYDMADYDWYRPGTSPNHYNLSSSTFVYLKYQNDWTAEKAKYIYEHADEVAKAVLEIVDEDKAAEFTGISDFLLDFVNQMFNNWGIMNVVNLLVKLGTATENESHTVANLIKDQIKVNGQNLNIDIRSWVNSFGYMYADQRVLADGEFVYTNKNGEYCVGTDGDTTTDGFQPDFDRTYPLAPSGFGGFNKVGGEYVPVASGGVGKRGEVTSYYKYTLNTTTKEVTYVLTNGTPDSSYSNKYPNLQVAFGEKDENDNYWHWKVKGNQYTSGTGAIGLANGTWYDLEDGSDNARACFTAIFCELMKPLMGVIGLIFTADDLSVFNNALTIKGYNCYDGAIIPVMEMLGVKNLKTQTEYSNDYKMSNASDPNGKAAGGFYYLVTKLFDALGDILSYDYDANHNVIKAPVQKVIELLPGIFYFFQSDGLSTLLKNLLMPVWVVVDTLRPIADVDLDDAIHQVLCNVLGLSYDKSAAQYASAPVVDMILNLTGLLKYIPYTAAQAAKDAQKVNAIYNLTLKDLSLNTVYEIVELFTGLDLAPLTYAFEGMCAGYTDINGDEHKVHVDSSSAYTGTGTRENALKKRYTLDYYGPDIITVTISVLLDLLRYGDNAAALDDLIGLTSDYFEGTTLSGMTASGFLEALEVVFKEKDESEKQYPNWDYLLEQDSIHIRRPQDGYAIAWVDGSYDLLREFSDMTPYHSIYNLAYRTDWTYDTALATNNMLSVILDYLTGAVFAKDNDEVTSFGDFVDGLLAEYVFSGDTLRSIAGLMCQLYNFIPAEIVALVDNLLDIHMTAWLGNDGYDTVLIKKDVERTYSNILSNSVMSVDVNDDGEITDDEKFDAYQIKANGTVIDAATYVPVVNARIQKTRMTVDEHGNYEPYVNDDGEQEVSYYIIGEVKSEEVTVPATDETPETTKTVTSVVWAYLADENFDTDASDYVPNYDWVWWADPSAAGYVDTRAEFIDALEDILAPSATLFSFIFLQRDYKLLYTAGDNLNGNPAGTADDTDAIIIDGVGAYADAVVPILEALGVPLTLQQYNTLKAKDDARAAADPTYKRQAVYYKDFYEGVTGTTGFAPSKYYNAAATTAADRYDGELWLSDMMDLFIALADAILDDPVNWILNRLPGLIYFINADGVTVALQNLFGDINDILDMINSILDVENRIDLGNLAGLKLDDLTLSGIFDIIYKFTGIYVREDLRDYMNNLFVGELSSFWSANGTMSFTMDYNATEDRADMITILVSLLVEILEDEGDFIDANNGYNYTHYNNPMAIDHLINSDLGENESGIVTDVLTALRNPAEIKIEGVDWNYFDHDYNLADNTDDETNMVATPGYAFQYLNYKSQWTYTAALSTAEGFEELLVGILGIVDKDKFGSITSLSEIINMDTVFTAESLQKILDFIAPFLYGEDAVLNETLLEVIGTLLGADLTQWNGQYAFESEEDLAGRATKPGYILTADTNLVEGKTYYVETAPGSEEFTAVATPDETQIKNYYEPLNLNYETKANYVLTADTELDESKTYYKLDDAGYTAIAADDLNVEEINTYYEFKANVKTYVVGNSEDFANGLALILRPASKLLSWLLLGDDYTFFKGNVDSSADDVLITIQGSHGYKEGLSLLLEALGFSGLKKESYYIQRGPVSFVVDLVNSVVDRLNTIIEDPVNEIIALIPEIIYFTNAHGLAVSIQNLLAGPLSLVNQFASLVAEEGESTVYDPENPNRVVNTLVEKLLKEALKNDNLTFALENVNLNWIMEIAEAFTGMEITDVVQNSLDMFYIGRIYSYSSKSEHEAYKMTFDLSVEDGGNGDFADFITILLSLLVDVATYPGNAAALVGMINGDKVQGDEGYVDPELVQNIVKFVKDGYVVNTENIDWFYFDDTLQIHTVTEDTETGVHTYTYTGEPIGPDNKVKTPERTINYLTYASDWTEDTAEYLVANRDDIISAVLRMTGNGDTTLAAIIKETFDPATSLYTIDTLNKIYDLIAPVLAELPSVLMDLAKIVLDVDFSFYADPDNRFSEENIDLSDDMDLEVKRQNFVNGLCDLLRPIYSILDWLLFNNDIKYFDKKIANFVKADKYVKTGDTELDPEKTYFVRTADGFAEVTEPNAENLDTYYEIGINPGTIYYVEKESGVFSKVEEPVAADIDQYYVFAGYTVKYEKTKDTALDPDKTYFVETADGFAEVTEPNAENLGSYYEEQDVEFLIDLPGAEGYAYGLIPILEALGVEFPPIPLPDEEQLKTEDVMFVLLNNVLARLEKILDDPVDEVLELLPNLLYFINTNGLSVCINNLLAGPLSLLDNINKALPEDDKVDLGALISNLLKGLPITIDLTKLDLMAIVKIIEEITTKSFYKQTTDTELDAEKTYYVAVPEYKEVTEPSADDLATYFEKNGEDAYVQTADTELVEGKTYYTETINYEKVEEPAAENIGSYYEVAYTAGLKIADVVTSEKIERFYLGQLVYFTSANRQPAYKMVYSDTEGMKDMLTVIANLAVEILLYKNDDTGANNAEAIDAMISGVNSEGKPNKSMVEGIVAIILGLKSLDDVDAAEINWDYFDEEVTLGDVTVPTNAFVYLDYCNEWTYEKAAYLDTGIVALVNEILALTTPEGEEPKTIDDLVAGLVDLDDLLSADLLNKILDAIAPILYGEDSFLDSYLLNVIGFALGADLTTWNYSYRFEKYDASKAYGDHSTGLKYRTDNFTVEGVTYENKSIFAIRDASDFATGLAYVLKPAARLLGWLLLGQDYGFFVDSATGQDILITVPGFNGYDSAVVLLLEALGCKNVNEGGTLKAGRDYISNEDKLLKDVIDALLARVDEILANPIDEILGLLPELIYFVNAGGLNAIVQNLAGGIFKVIDYVNDSGLLKDPIEIDLNDLVSGFINEAYAKMKDIDVEDIETPFEFELETVTLQTVIDAAEFFTGLKIGDAIGYSLATFAIGEKYAYQTVSEAYADNTYKMRFAETGDGTDKARDRADMITIVLSLALDVLRYDGNAAALAALLSGVMDGKITEDVINGVINVIDGCTIEMMNMKGWFYAITDPTWEYVSLITPDTEITMVPRTINYLSYNSDWTEETAEYVIDNLDEIIAAVLTLTGQDETTVAAIIEKNFKISDLYTAENLNKIVDLIKGLFDKLGVTLSNLVGMILADNESIVSAYDAMTFTDDQITDRATFAAGLATVIAPIGGLLDWILFGKDLAFFYDHTFYGPDNGEDLLKIKGAEGYAYGLVPLLEALGVTGLPDVTDDTNTNAILAQVVDAVLNRVETILADPEDELIALLPNLIYFINANGISVSVNNLLVCLLGLLEEVNPVIEALGIEIPLGDDLKVTKIEVNDILNYFLKDYLNGYDQIDVKNLKLLDIVEIVEAVTGLEITDVVTELKIENFYLGQVTPFWSTNGDIAFRMGYTTKEDKHDMLTILLNFLVEVALYEDEATGKSNKDALVALLKLGDDTAAIVDAIVALLTGQVDPYEYSEFKWNYANGSITIPGDDVQIIVPKSEFIYLAYQNNWTPNKAQMLDSQLVATVDSIIHLIDPTKATLSDLIAGYVDLDELVFNATNLNKLYGLVSGLLYGENAVIPSVLGEAAGLLLGADLTEFNDLYSFEDKDEAKTYLTDDGFGLEYRVESGKAIYAIDGKDSFVNGLVRILKPAEKLLGWLLLGDDYGFFVDNATGNEVLLKIGGGEGYAKGLALLLEALGVDGLEPDYANASVLLRTVLTKLVGRVEDILTNPIDEVLALVPELIYFINANGLGVVVNNLAAAAFNLLDAIIEAGIIPDVTDRKVWVNNLIGDALRKALNNDELTFDLNGINIQWIVDLAEAILADKVGPIQINAVLAESIRGATYPLSILQIGKAYKYDSVSAFDTAYRCDYDAFTDDNSKGAARADLITMLLSFAIDMLRNEDNQSVIEDLAHMNAGTIASILDVLTEFTVNITPTINWTYFDPDYSFTPGDDLTGFEPSINYLTYASDWTPELANYVDNNLESIIAAVFEIIDKDKPEDEKIGSVANLIKKNVDIEALIYNADNLNKIIDLVKELLTKLEGDLATLVPAAVELLLDVDLHAWDNMYFESGEICDKQTFIDGLYEVLEPIFPLLDWMLFDDSYAFFNRSTADDNIEDLLVIDGYAGYAYGLVPLLEALGVTVPPVKNPNAADYNTAGQLKGVLEATLTRMERILADPVEEVLALLPNILYFINANGLAAAVNNLLGVALQLVDRVNVVLDNLAAIGVTIPIGDETLTEIDVNYLVNHFAGEYLRGYEVDTKKLDLIEVIKIVEVFTGLDLESFVRENGIERFFVGEITYFESANGRPAYKMVYRDRVDNVVDGKDRSDMITVLFNYLIEAAMYGDNAKTLDILISGADETGAPKKTTVETILSMIRTLGTVPLPGDYHWYYFNEDTDSGDPDYSDTELPTTPFNNHLRYAKPSEDNDWISTPSYVNNWTQETANAIYDNLDDVITAILTIIAKGDPDKATTVAELLGKNFQLFTADNLNKIADLIKQLYEKFDATLIRVIGQVLGCDLTKWEGLRFDDAEVYDADTFANGLYEIVEPLSRVLDWLLFGESYGFFVKDADGATTLINIGGANGYLYGLVPILVALGIDEHDLPEYTDDTVCMTEVNGKTFLKAVLDLVADRAAEILADPVDEALELLPGLLYFINANGVSTAAYNLAGGVLNAINVLFQNGIISLKVDGETFTNIEDYLAASVGIDIRNLDLEGILTFIEAKGYTQGIKINEVFTGTYTKDDTTGEVEFTYDAEGGQNILEKFYCGVVQSYTYGGFNGNKMVAGADKQGDILTMLLSIVLDVLYYEGNEEAITALINRLWTDVEFTQDNFVALKMLLQKGAEFSTKFSPNWTYVVENEAEYIELIANDPVAAIMKVVDEGLPAMKGRTQRYLEYDNNWNANTVNYLNTHLNTIVDLIINKATGYLDLEKFIEDKLPIYTAENFNKIVDKLAGLISKLDEVLTKELQKSLVTAAGSLLGLNDEVAEGKTVLDVVTEPVTEATVHDKETFVQAFVDHFSVLNRVLDWLLFDQDLKFFYSLEDGTEPMIVINGGEGYKYGLAPILAALGVDTEIEAESCKDGALEEVLNKVADRIDELLYGGPDEEHPTKTLDEVLALLPELIYFINTGAINEALKNLLQPADELLKIVNDNLGNGAVLGKNSVADFFSFTFNGTEYRLYDNTIDLDDADPAKKNYNVIDFDFIFDLVKDKVGIDIANSTGTSADTTELGKVGDYIKTFYFGQLESYTSYGEIPGYRMNYSEEDTRMDMLTILVTLVLDVFTSNTNRDALIKLLGDDDKAEELYDIIFRFLTGDEIAIKYYEFDWKFAEYADTGIIISPMTEDGSVVNQDIYGPLYTRPMGEYMTKYLQLAIDTYVTLLGLKVNGKQVFTLEDILTELVGSNIYKNEYLNSIYGALKNLLTGLKEDTLGEELYEDIAYVLKEATRDPDNDEDIGVDLNYWFNEYEGPEEIEEGNQEQFIAEICKMLRPAYPILRWLLTEDKIAFFNKAAGADQYSTDTLEALDDNDYLVLNGAAGYKYGIIPILEALCNGDNTTVKSYSEYLADVAADPTGDALLADILTPILTKVDDILADPINGVLNLLPAVVYFVASNGLDTCFKNLLGSVFSLLETINPLIANVEKLHDEDGNVSLYPLINFDLRVGKDLDLKELLAQLLDSLKESTGFTLTDLGLDLVDELSMGVIEEYNSHINEDTFFQDMYTMKYAEEGTDVEGNKCDKVDFVTIVLRLVLTFISDPDNKDAVEGMLKDKVSEDGYTLLCSLLDNFSAMVRTPDGKDKVMYTFYYVFYSALVAGVATNNAFAEFNGNYSFLNSLFNTSDLAFMRAIGQSLTSIFHMTDSEGNEVISPIIDETGVVPQGQIPFWQKIIEFFKQIINFFKNLFK